MVSRWYSDARAAHAFERGPTWREVASARRRLALPKNIEKRSLTSLQQRLVKAGVG
jgi:hypothetical protein